MSDDWTPTRIYTDAEIEAGKTPRGGFTRAQLAEWGVPWPPRSGWRTRLTTGLSGSDVAAMLEQPEADDPLDPAKLLRKVVVAVINAGHASDLYEFPDVLAYFGAQMPDKEAA